MQQYNLLAAKALTIVSSFMQSLVLPNAHKEPPTDAVKFLFENNVDIFAWHIGRYDEYDMYRYWCSNWTKSNKLHICFILEGTAITASVDIDRVSLSLYHEGKGGGKEFIDALKKHSEGLLLE